MRWYVRFYEFDYRERKYTIKTRVIQASGSADVVRILGPERPLIDMEIYEDRPDYDE